MIDALGGSKQSTFWESQEASEGHMTHTGSICNPAIPGTPPKVGVRVCPCVQVCVNVCVCVCGCV